MFEPREIKKINPKKIKRAAACSSRHSGYTSGLALGDRAMLTEINDETSDRETDEYEKKIASKFFSDISVFTHFYSLPTPPLRGAR